MNSNSITLNLTQIKSIVFLISVPFVYLVFPFSLLFYFTIIFFNVYNLFNQKYEFDFVFLELIAIYYFKYFNNDIFLINSQIDYLFSQYFIILIFYLILKIDLSVVSKFRISLLIIASILIEFYFFKEEYLIFNLVLLLIYVIIRIKVSSVNYLIVILFLFYFCIGFFFSNLLEISTLINYLKSPIEIFQVLLFLVLYLEKYSSSKIFILLLNKFNSFKTEYLKQLYHSNFNKVIVFLKKYVLVIFILIIIVFSFCSNKFYSKTFFKELADYKEITLQDSFKGTIISIKDAPNNNSFGAHFNWYNKIILNDGSKIKINFSYLFYPEIELLSKIEKRANNKYVYIFEDEILVDSIELTFKKIIIPKNLNNSSLILKKYR